MAALWTFGQHFLTIETGIRQGSVRVEEFTTHIDHSVAIPNLGLFEYVSPSPCSAKDATRADGPVTIDWECPEGHIAPARIVVTSVKPRNKDRDSKPPASETSDEVPRVLIVFIQALAVEAWHAAYVEVLELHLVNAEFFAQPDEVRHKFPVIF
jgi:hypothetical protein